MKCKSVYIDPKTHQQFNCGKCPACRANSASTWKLRCLYELDDWSSAIFVTLTYSEDWLISHNMSAQGYATLRKKEIQDFTHRLREDIRYNEPDRILPKYFFVGEYSPKPKERPHYHGIIFGMDKYNDRDRQYIIDNWCPPNALRCEPWQFDMNRGIKDGIATVTPESIGYVTDYANKNLFGVYAKEEYQDKGREKPFKLNSQGLGLNFALKNKERLIRNGFTYLPTGKKIGLPRYYRDKLGVEIDFKQRGDLKERLLEENRELVQLFEKETNLRPSHSNLDFYTRRFEQWYENYRWCLSSQVYEDFVNREKLIHKERV